MGGPLGGCEEFFQHDPPASYFREVAKLTHLLRRTRGPSALNRMILCAMRVTTTSVSHASTRIGSALASFLHRLLGGAKGV